MIYTKHGGSLYRDVRTNWQWVERTSVPAGKSLPLYHPLQPKSKTVGTRRVVSRNGKVLTHTMVKRAKRREASNHFVATFETIMPDVLAYIDAEKRKQATTEKLKALAATYAKV